MANTKREANGARFAPHDTPARFWSKVDRSDSCWQWLGGGLSPAGYGRFFTKAPGEKVKAHMAHRWAYEHLVGPIPEGLTIDHLCRNTGCVNPSHMEPVTRTENTRRGNPSWKQKAARVECLQGHPYDETNTYRTPQGIRQCRVCNAAHARLRRAQRRG